MDDRVVILRLGRFRAGEARLMASVEFYPEDNEVVSKVYDAESPLKYATEPRYAHLGVLVGIQAVNIIVGKSTDVIRAVHSNKRFIEEIWLWDEVRKCIFACAKVPRIFSVVNGQHLRQLSTNS